MLSNSIHSDSTSQGVHSKHRDLLGFALRGFYENCYYVGKNARKYICYVKSTSPTLARLPARDQVSSSGKFPSTGCSSGATVLVLHLVLTLLACSGQWGDSVGSNCPSAELWCPYALLSAEEWINTCMCSSSLWTHLTLAHKKYCASRKDTGAKEGPKRKFLAREVETRYLSSSPSTFDCASAFSFQLRLILGCRGFCSCPQQSFTLSFKSAFPHCKVLLGVERGSSLLSFEAWRALGYSTPQKQFST